MLPLWLAINVLRATWKVKKSGGIIALTLHNLEPHQHLNRFQVLVWRYYKVALLKQVDLFISLSDDALKAFKNANPDFSSKCSVVVPHPHYRTSYPTVYGMASSRMHFKLPLNARIIGMIGSIRPSKKTPEAIEAFVQAAGANDLLFIAGQCDDEHWKELQASRGGDTRVVILRDFLDDQTLNMAVAACNAILLNQEKMLNSGTALLALSLNRPLIAIQAGSMQELAASMGEGWIYLFPGPISGDSLRHAIKEIHCDNDRNVADLDHLDPAVLSSKMIKIFDNMLSSKNHEK